MSSLISNKMYDDLDSTGIRKKKCLFWKARKINNKCFQRKVGVRIQYTLMIPQAVFAIKPISHCDLIIILQFN